jgi:hypothetical protein
VTRALQGPRSCGYSSLGTRSRASVPTGCSSCSHPRANGRLQPRRRWPGRRQRLASRGVRAPARPRQALPAPVMRRRAACRAGSATVFRVRRLGCARGRARAAMAVWAHRHRRRCRLRSSHLRRRRCFRARESRGRRRARQVSLSRRQRRDTSPQLVAGCRARGQQASSCRPTCCRCCRPATG